MMEVRKYIIPVLTIGLAIGFITVFTNIFIYLVISSLIALLGMPIMTFITKIKFNTFKINHSIAAILTLCFFISLLYIGAITFLPILISQVSFLSDSNMKDILHNITHYYPELKSYSLYFGSEELIINEISAQVGKFLKFENISFLLNNAISYSATIFGGLFSVLFISFFFLKDEKLVVRSLLLITPSAFEKEMHDILKTSKKMLSQYFVGLFMDIVFVSIIVTVFMWIFGIRNALVIGCLAGIMNVIPYIGPIITLSFSLLLGISGCIELNQYELISSTSIKICIILISTNLIDALIIQPTIFSNSVKAHPLELFLVILMASVLGGVIGMVIAIPTYTLIRIVAKEFLSHLKFFKKLTENISN